MKILISTDPTKNGQTVARCWAMFPLPSETDICILQVIEVGTSQLDSDHSRVWERTLNLARAVWEKEAHHFLEKVRQGFSNVSGNPTQVMTAEGSPPEEILRIIKTQRIDLAVLGNRGLSGIKRFLLGSTSDRVVRESPCSVFIFRNKSRYTKKSSITKNFKVLLASEGPTDGSLCFETLQSLNFLGSTSISIVQVVEKPGFLKSWIFTKGSPQLVKMGEELMSKAQRAGQKHVREVSKKLTALGKKIKTFLASGNAADEILKVEKRVKPDVIVLGAQAWTEGEPTSLGEVARKVARYATCSVFVVKEKA